MDAIRKTYIFGNWKEHFNTSQASLLVHRLEERIRILRDVEVALFPNVLVLQPLSVMIDRRKFKLGAQDGYSQDAGAYTGEVSMAMLSGLVSYVLAGHSERRYIFNEDDNIIGKKVAAAVRNDITPVLCVGETKEERLAKETNQVLHNQVTGGLMHLTAREVDSMVIAYEPVWAVGTGEFAKPDQVVKALAFIRRQVGELYGPAAAERLRVLYGGSVNDGIVRSYLELEGCDGVLVGGASLNYQQFAGIVDAAARLQQERRG